MPAQGPQLGRERAEPLVRLRRIGARVAKIIQRLDQAAGIRGQIRYRLRQSILTPNGTPAIPCAVSRC